MDTLPAAIELLSDMGFTALAQREIVTGSSWRIVIEPRPETAVTPHT